MNDKQKICFIHHSDYYRRCPLGKVKNSLILYWFTDRYFDLLASKHSAYKYLYFFIKDYCDGKYGLSFRDGIKDAHRKYMEFKVWAENRGGKNNGYREPPILTSCKRIEPDLIAEYVENEKDFFAIYPKKLRRQKLELFDSNGYSKNFLLTRLLELFPEISDSGV